MARRVVLEIDNREKTPFLFPSSLVWSPKPYRRELIEVEIVRRELDFGDYRLAEYPTACVVERKKTMDELAMNLLTTDRGRFEKAWQRFVSGCRFPVLVIEQPASAATVLKGTYKRITGVDVLGALHRLVAGVDRLTVFWVGSMASPATRRSLGAHLIRLMLSYGMAAEEQGTEEQGTEEQGNEYGTSSSDGTDSDSRDRVRAVPAGSAGRSKRKAERTRVVRAGRSAANPGRRPKSRQGSDPVSGGPADSPVLLEAVGAGGA